MQATEDSGYELSSGTFEKLHEFIIERNDFELALVSSATPFEFCDQDDEEVETPGRIVLQYGICRFVADFRAEVYKWAVYALRSHSSMEQRWPNGRA